LGSKRGHRGDIVNCWRVEDSKRGNRRDIVLFASDCEINIGGSEYGQR
jgi:hypothetical protein